MFWRPLTGCKIDKLNSLSIRCTVISLSSVVLCVQSRDMGSMDEVFMAAMSGPSSL